KKSFFRKLEKFDEICTVSKEMGEELIKLAPDLKEKQKTVYNPIDVEEIKKKSKDDRELTEWEKKLIKEKYICSVGRLDENQKDFTTLIKAFGELKKEEKIKEKLIIIGDGPDKIRLEELVSNLKIKDVVFLGKKLNPYIWMKNSKLFILSSKYEGFPTVLVEATSLKVPAISSDCPTGPKEILKNSNLLFKVGVIDELKAIIMNKVMGV
uniref:glycosyltransferase n=1 Tax=uncultured Fusobacterium sp. TaxID=159267 RepID=UPI0025F17E8F